MAIMAIQFLVLPITASTTGSGSLSFTTAQHPTITISVQNYTDIQGHNDILTATTSYSNDQLSLVIGNHVSKFGIGSLTFNLSVLPIGTYSVSACDKQAEFCSTLETVIIKGAPASAPQPQSQTSASSSSTPNSSTSSTATTSTTKTTSPSQSTQPQASSSGTSNTVSKNTTGTTIPVRTYQNNNTTTANTITSNTISTNATTNTTTTTSATSQTKASNSSTAVTAQNTSTTTATTNASSQQSGNTTTTSFSGSISLGTILPVLLGIAIAIALGYTVINSRKKGVQGAA